MNRQDAKAPRLGFTGPEGRKLVAGGGASVTSATTGFVVVAAPGASMTAAFEAIDRSARTGETLRRLQLWLHHPASPVKREEVAAALAPFTSEPASVLEESTR